MCAIILRCSSRSHRECFRGDFIEREFFLDTKTYLKDSNLKASERAIT